MSMLSPKAGLKVLAVLGTLAASVAPISAQESYKCLPTCSVNDGRFLAIAGSNLVTLSDTQISLEILVPAGSTSFQVGIFDGESGAVDGSGRPHWDTGTLAVYEYSLFADPKGDGTGTTVVDLAPGSPSILSTGMPDNGWIDFTVLTGPEALTPSGHYFYLLTIQLTTPALTTQNAFKIRTSALLSGLTLNPVAQPFSYLASWTNIGDITTIYPSFPATTPTTYDGTFRFYFDVPVSRQALVLWDGDFDRGKFDGTDKDTDDPDTPPALPAWATADAQTEGIAVGAGGSTGAPADDRSGAGLGVYLLRAPSVRYNLIFPNGDIFSNENPSGNQEWEQFKVSTDLSEAADHYTDAIRPGVYELEVSGVDLQNLNALLLPLRLLCVDEAGNPCELLRPFLLGDKVFLDFNGNGIQEAGEPGIPGVRVKLFDEDGFLLETTATAADGSYLFPVDSFTYRVELDTASLSGAISTTNPLIVANVLNDNVTTADFGLRGTGSVGDAVWFDTNGDGLQNEGSESGLGGVRIVLEGDLDGNGSVDLTLSTTTDAAGHYIFSSLLPGSYRVIVDPASLAEGLAATFDADGVSTPQVATVSLSAGENLREADFGYGFGSGGTTIGDYVWRDSDGDGNLDSAELGLEGITLVLSGDIDSDGIAEIQATTTTDAQGFYRFSWLPTGTYTVMVVVSSLPDGHVQTFDADGIVTANRATAPVTAPVGNADFDFGYRPAFQPGTGTLGYWKNHPEAWPVQQIVISGITYSKSQAVDLMRSPGRGDKTIDLFKQLVAARLNVMIGNSSTCIEAAIDGAEAWLASFPVGSGVKGGSAAWKSGDLLHGTLDKYNNGQLCAPHRD